MRIRKHGTVRAGLAILAGGLSFVGSSSATDLILNGSFEAGGGGANWTGSFSTYNYSQNYTVPTNLPPSEVAGTVYSWSQGSFFGSWDSFVTPTNETDHLQFNLQFAGKQTVNLTSAVSGATIDSGTGRYTFSAWLASYQFAANVEQPYVVLRFYDDFGTNQVGGNVIFDRTTNRFAISYATGFPTNPPPANLTLDHEWIKYAVTNTLPVGARKATVYITRSPKTGLKNAPDTYVDLVKLDVIDATPPTIATPPASQVAALGNSASFSVSATGSGTLAYQWQHAGTNLPGATASSLTLPLVTMADAGSYAIVVTNVFGAATSSPPATLSIFNPLVLVTGQWDFGNSNLVASCGQDLEYFDGTVAADTSFGTTTGFGISDIGGQPATVMHFNPSITNWGGFKMHHGATPNGGGLYVNQYTLVFDIYYQDSQTNKWGSFFQSNTANSNDGDFFVRPDNLGGGIGIGGIYHGAVSANAWHRIAFAFDLSGPGLSPILTKFIDGVKVGEQTAGLSTVDGRFSLDPFLLLFADESGDTREAYVSSVQFSNGRRADAFLAALGGPTSTKIPGCIRASLEGGNIVVRWTGSVNLEGADDITGPWSIVAPSSPYTVSSPTAKKFYRPKIP